MPKEIISIIAIASLAVAGGSFAARYSASEPVTFDREELIENVNQLPPWPLPLDIFSYDEHLLRLAHYRHPTMIPAATSTLIGATSTLATRSTSTSPSYGTSTNVTLPGKRWPADTVYPHGGAIIPFERIVAYYGNFYSKQMGILGEYSEDEVLARLASTTEAWEKADPNTPVRPAIHYIAMVAQNGPGEDGMYRAVMPNEEIERAHAMARRVSGILFIDLQVGKSTLEKELSQYKKYFERPDVHLALDPEFSMKDGSKPGRAIGTMDAADINYAIKFLSEVVRTHRLPPKVIVVHRFTEKMLTNYNKITPTAEVQVVINMDGWGSKQLKRNTYQAVITPEPVQFSGVKIFYKNDLRPPSTGIFSPEEVLSLYPIPIYIQYQ